MPAGDFIKGKNLRLKVEGGTVFHATECGFSTSRELEDIATKDTNGKRRVPGDYDFSATTSMMLAEKAASGTQHDVYDLLQIFKDGVKVDIEFTTDIQGSKVISGSYYIQQCDIAASNGSTATGNFSFAGDGEFEIETVA